MKSQSLDEGQITRFLDVIEGLTRKHLTARLYTEHPELCSTAMQLSRWRRKIQLPSLRTTEKIVRWSASLLFKGDNAATTAIRTGFVESFITGAHWPTIVELLLTAPNELLDLRKALRITQQEAGVRCGVSRQIYNEWENGTGSRAQIERARRALSS
jgi:transcriptional regulator with XRE-family HTH domain